MKTKILIAIIGIGLCLTAFRSATDKSSATVERQQGLYIFMLCKPTASYDYLGSIKIKVTWMGQPPEMLNIALKKVKAEYPKAEGIIFTSLNMENVDAIAFKEP